MSHDIKFSCPHCGQNIEAPSTSTGANLACPTCGQTFIVPRQKTSVLRVLLLFFSVVLAVALVGGGLLLYKFRAFEKQVDAAVAEDAAKPQSQTDKNLALRDQYINEAEIDMGKECSNYVGFSRLLEHYLNTENNSVSNWSGRATIDYINKVGGVERTNLLFTFFLGDGHCFAYVNEEAMYNRQQKEAGETR